MSNIKIGKIVEGQITGVTKYGVFVSLEDNYTGMIHISEVSNKYIEDLNNIFTNNICAGILFDNDNNWYGDCWVEKDKIDSEPKEIFDFVFKEKEFRTKLLKKGYRAKFVFWNPIDNTEVVK